MKDEKNERTNCKKVSWKNLMLYCDVSLVVLSIVIVLKLDLMDYVILYILLSTVKVKHLSWSEEKFHRGKMCVVFWGHRKSCSSIPNKSIDMWCREPESMEAIIRVWQCGLCLFVCKDLIVLFYLQSFRVADHEFASVFMVICHFNYCEDWCGGLRKHQHWYRLQRQEQYIFLELLVEAHPLRSASQCRY